MDACQGQVKDHYRYLYKEHACNIQRSHPSGNRPAEDLPLRQEEIQVIKRKEHKEGIKY